MMDQLIECRAREITEFMCFFVPKSNQHKMNLVKSKTIKEDSKKIKRKIKQIILRSRDLA